MNKDNSVIKRQGPDNTLWYVVAHAADMAAAAIPAGLLQSASIPVYLFREAAGSSAIPLSYGLLGGVDIAVPESFYDEATALLENDVLGGWDENLSSLTAGDEES